MKSMATRILPILGLWLLVFGLAAAQETIENTKQGFAITLPQGWTNEELRVDFRNTYLRASSPVGIEDAALYVQIFEVGRFTPESYRKSVRRYITTRMEGTVLSEQEVTAGTAPGWRIEYEGVSVGFAGRRRHFLNTVFFHKNRIYVVHCAARTQRWDEFKGAFLTASDSLAFMEPDEA